MRLRHKHKLNHKLAHVVFVLSLQHYSNIMRRILLVYMMYLGAYFSLFERCLHLRLYRRFRVRGAYLAVLGSLAGSAFAWASWRRLWQWWCAGALGEPRGWESWSAAAPDACSFVSCRRHLDWLLLLRLRLLA